jgi:hypothetical protein
MVNFADCHCAIPLQSMPAPACPRQPTGRRQALSDDRLDRAIGYAAANRFKTLTSLE